MYLLLLPVLAAFVGVIVWRLSGRTDWKRPARLLAAVLAGALAAALLYRGMLILAIYAWQWSDPVTW